MYNTCDSSDTIMQEPYENEIGKKVLNSLLTLSAFSAFIFRIRSPTIDICSFMLAASEPPVGAAEAGFTDGDVTVGSLFAFFEEAGF